LHNPETIRQLAARGDHPEKLRTRDICISAASGSGPIDHGFLPSKTPNRRIQSSARLGQESTA
jgi:hypothetical protein